MKKAIEDKFEGKVTVTEIKKIHSILKISWRVEDLDKCFSEEFNLNESKESFASSLKESVSYSLSQ